MKKSIILLALLVSVPVFSATTKTTTTNVYEETATSPATNPDMIEAQEYDGYEEDMNEEMNQDMNRNHTQERMEERSETTTVEKSDAIDYSDRTRTNRERKALNTGSHASDDQ